MKAKKYEKELRKLQARLCHLQDWVKQKGLRVIIVFEGRDAAGKGGAIRRFTENLSPRTHRIVALPKPSDVGSDVDIQQWATVLRSVSAHRSYRWFYRDSTYRPWLVAEFLILREEMPRSLTFCYQWITRSLDGLAEDYGKSYDCQRGAGDIYARLEAGKMDDIFQSGLHEFLQDFVKANNQLAADIAQTYNFP